MTTFLSCLASSLRGSSTSWHHAFNLKFPPIMHQVLDDKFINNFTDVLIIGDIHGCYDELMLLLEKANSLNDTTLKVFTGDLINKGPKNHEVLTLLKASTSMLSVRGNHDEWVLKEYYLMQDAEYKSGDGNLWIKELQNTDIDYLNNLPYTISLPKFKAIVVHAGLTPGLPLHGNDPTKLVTMRNIVVSDSFGGVDLTGIKQDNVGEPWASQWPGPAHVYFGHDAKRKLQRYPYATGLDTGCVYGGCLTGLFISGPKKGTFVSVEPLNTYRVPKQNRKKSE